MLSQSFFFLLLFSPLAVKHRLVLHTFDSSLSSSFLLLFLDREAIENAVCSGDDRDGSIDIGKRDLSEEKQSK